MAKIKQATKKNLFTGENILYTILYIFYILGSIPYKLFSFIASLIAFFIDIFFLCISSIAAIILLTGIMIIVISKFLSKNISQIARQTVLKSKKGLIVTGRTTYKYKIPLFTPILFFSILYVAITFIGNVKSQEKKIDQIPENVKIYDNTHKVLYNGTFDHIEEARYVREKELVEQIITELRTDPNFNVVNNNRIVVYMEGTTIKHIFTEEGKHLYGSRLDLFFNK